MPFFRDFRFHSGVKCRQDTQKAEAPVKLGFSVPIAQESIVSDSHKPRGNNVEQEAPDELDNGQCHVFTFIPVGIVLPGEGDRVVGNGDDAMIANCNTVRIPAEILENRLGSGERRFCVNDPLGIVEGVEEVFQCLGIFILPQGSVQSDGPVVKPGFEIIEHFSFEQGGKRFNGKKEILFKMLPLFIAYPA